MKYWKNHNLDLYNIIFNNIAGFNEEVGEMIFSFLARNEKNHLVEDIFVKKNKDFLLINIVHKINSCFGEKYVIKRKYLTITDHSIQRVTIELNQIHSEVTSEYFFCN